MLKSLFMSATLLTSLLCLSEATAIAQDQSPGDNDSLLIGTWKGVFNSSGQRLAYNDDVVLFRFERDSRRPSLWILFADKLVRGERIPLYKVEDLEYDENSETITKTGPRPLPSGAAYSIVIDRRPALQTLTFSFFASDGSISRHVEFKLVDSRRLPPAPESDTYPSLWLLRNSNSPGEP